VLKRAEAGLGSGKATAAGAGAAAASQPTQPVQKDPKVIIAGTCVTSCSTIGSCVLPKPLRSRADSCRNAVSHCCLAHALSGMGYVAAAAVMAAATCVIL
jgi:hypothetical protein